jgi:bacterioferritin
MSREKLITRLNEDLAREYQSIISYVIYSQVLKGPECMAIARELEMHAHAVEELQHALYLAKQTDHRGGTGTAGPKVDRRSEEAQAMLRMELEKEKESIQHYRDRLRECESLQEYAIAERIRLILIQEEEHLTDLATALNEPVPETPAVDSYLATALNEPVPETPAVDS